VNEGPTDRVGRWLLSWSRFVRRRARAIVILTPVVIALLGWYTSRTLHVNTDTSGLVSDDLEYRQIYNAYQDAFPNGADRLVIVVEGRTSGLAGRAARLLVDEMRADSALFGSVYAPGVGSFWDSMALLYMPADSIAELVERLDRSADLLVDLERNPTLDGLTTVVERALESDATGPGGTEEGTDLVPILGLLTSTVFAASEGRFEPVPWSALTTGRAPTAQDRRRTITVTPQLAFENRVPGAEAIAGVREIVRKNGLVERQGIRILLTGGVAIEADELETAVAGVRQAGFLALVSVALILFLALRSIRLILAALATLGAGLIVTGAVASVTVGSLNLISVAFAVLYVGLGIDYAIHLCLWYRARRAQGLDHGDALDSAVSRVGPSLALSAITTAACFYAFLPTDFVGVSELGLIGGNGMFVSLFVTLTILPAILTVFPPGDVAQIASGGLPRLGRVLSRWSRPILWLTAIGTAGAVWGARSARFDHNPLNLRDPTSESVVAYRALLDDPVAKPMSISVLRPDAAAIAEVGRVAAGSDVIEGTRSVFDFVPEQQDEKRGLLTTLAERLEQAGTREVATATGPDQTPVERLTRALNDYRWRATSDEGALARQLYHVLRAWERRVEGWPEEDRAGHVSALEAALVGTLPAQVASLRAAARPEPVTESSLPQDLRERWIGTNGSYRVEIIPAESLVENERLRAYADGVREIVPDATGEAVSELETGRVAVAAFRKALGLAGIVTVIILVLLQRNLLVVAYVVGPLILAGVWTAGLTGWLDLPFNFANVIALPLLLGVGVDNGIHMAHGARIGRGDRRDPMVTSTSRAVLFATLTTMASFGNLAFAIHVGMASMGRLLTIGMACVLFATLIALPAMMAATQKATGVE
jgi:hopanoid biosynthesis associated RND transporter like protein HpnN